MDQLLPNHKFINDLFEYESFHYRDGPTLCSLYNVTLLIDLPRQNLSVGRKFQHVLIDLEEKCFKIYYKNNKSSCIYFHELVIN